MAWRRPVQQQLQIGRWVDPMSLSCAGRLPGQGGCYEFDVLDQS